MRLDLGWPTAIIAPSYWAMHVCYSKLKCSDLFYIFMWTTYQFWYRFSLRYSTQQQKYSILARSVTLIWTQLVFLLCNSYVLKQTEVYRSLMYIYWDNISTPISVMSFVVRISLRYSVIAIPTNSSSVHI